MSITKMKQPTALRAIIPVSSVCLLIFFRNVHLTGTLAKQHYSAVNTPRIFREPYLPRLYVNVRQATAADRRCASGRRAFSVERARASLLAEKTAAPGRPRVLRPYEISAIKSLPVKFAVVPPARLRSVVPRRWMRALTISPLLSYIAHINARARARASLHAHAMHT